MESYKSNRPKSKSLFTAIVVLSSAWYFISIIPLSAQERVDIDTLWYRYHNPEQDYYPDLLPEDCYMELYLENGILKNGMDCSGLVTAALGIPRWTTSSGPIPGMQKVNLINKNENFVSELQTGDILVWKGVHTAIYDAEKGKIFHAHGAKGTPVGYTSDLLTYWFKEHKLPTVYRK